MKRFVQVASTLSLLALLTAPAFAAGYKSDMVCEFGPGQGTVNIAPNGNVTINMNNLYPNTYFECGVYCAIFGEGVDGACVTNNKGHFSVQLPEQLGVCIGPIGFVDFFCASGVVGNGP